MGIRHLSDLPINRILKIILNLNDATIVEKIDGSNLRFGYENGSFYTRYKNTGKIYNIDSYSTTNPADEYRIFAHSILSGRLQSLPKLHFRNFEIECEVLVDHAPNVLEYGISGIVLLRQLSGDPVSLEDIEGEGHNETVIVKAPSKKLSEVSKGIISEVLDDINNFLESESACYSGLTRYDVYFHPLNRKIKNLPDEYEWSSLKERLKVSRSSKTSKSFGREEIEESIGDIIGVIDRDFNDVKLCRSKPEGYIVLDDDKPVKLVDRKYFLRVKDLIWYHREAYKNGKMNKDEVTESIISLPDFDITHRGSRCARFGGKIKDRSLQFIRRK